MKHNKYLEVNESEGESSLLAIVGIVVAGVVILVIAGIVGFIFYKYCSSPFSHFPFFIPYSLFFIMYYSFMNFGSFIVCSIFYYFWNRRGQSARDPSVALEKNPYCSDTMIPLFILVFFTMLFSFSSLLFSYWFIFNNRMWLLEPNNVPYSLYIAPHKVFLIFFLEYHCYIVRKYLTWQHLKEHIATCSSLLSKYHYKY